VQQTLPPQVSSACEINSWLEGESFEEGTLGGMLLTVAFLGLQHDLVEHLALQDSSVLDFLQDVEGWSILPAGEKLLTLPLVLQIPVGSRKVHCLSDLFGPFCLSSEERGRGSQQDSRPRAMRERQMHCRAVSLAAYCLRTEFW
jgi:hypothetical protein